MTSCRLTVSSVGFLWSVKQAKVGFFSQLYVCSKLISMPSYAFKSCWVAGRFVVALFSACSFSKIVDSVVSSVAVNVVNTVNRPFAVSKKPSKTVLKVEFPVECNSTVSPIHGGSSPAAIFPCKYTSVRVIIESGQKNFRSHSDASLETM